ncbi:calcium/sodium antiporter [Psychrosphaera sp. B3R10]|uniref:calcium/sodium antiporter n=1 Tax=unclassified Psychrosphaera TaxID=2641570 RepID=UPI001C097482|nr:MULTISPECIES: calcium/sodium antiporter [unclassified Psychrosphaera]MBU2881928.1 calcium/sodium antiporter [Psychrosphaera sp. I2R16]MBU2991239.1 calcium/sodium antiporter [Psychrosphaera sp. B3R10]
MLSASIILILSFAVLVWSADKFVYGASGLARNLGVSPMIIGLTIVAMGSSAPEIMVSANAALNGATDTSVGNALGSNITNILLVLGITTMVRPLTVSSTTLYREMPILLGFTLLAWYILSDNVLSFNEGIGLLVGFFMFIGFLIFLANHTKNPNDPLLADNDDEIPSDLPTLYAVLWVIAGLIMLPLSSHFLVNSAVIIAQFFGISDLVIGLTIIAIGTSLPELAASVAGVLKGEDDMAIGNVIGSNIFNILAVLSVGALIHPSEIDPNAASRDIFVMIGATVALLFMAMNFKGTRRINRVEGGLLLVGFVAYQIVLFS